VDECVTKLVDHLSSHLSHIEDDGKEKKTVVLQSDVAYAYSMRACVSLLHPELHLTVIQRMYVTT
jgi:hypothetical protein